MTAKDDESDMVTCPFCGMEMTRDEYEGSHSCDPDAAEKYVREILTRKGLVW